MKLSAQKIIENYSRKSALFFKNSSLNSALVTLNYKFLYKKKYIQLLPDEKLVTVKEFAFSNLKPVSTLDALMLLSRSTSVEEIGKHGAPLAGSTIPGMQERELKLYEALFGRDSLKLAEYVIDDFPLLTKTTLLELAKYQGTSNRQGNEEELGKIPHEVRDAKDPIAQELSKKKGWEFPYYGSIDATVLYIQVVAKYCRRYGEAFLNEKYIAKNKKEYTVRDAIEKALAWLVRRLNTNKEGLLEYKKVHEHSMETQSWRDSWDGYPREDGSVADNTYGIASLEVQVDAVMALYSAITLGIGDKHVLLKKAEKLRKYVLQRFWVEDDRGGYFALATERDKNNVLHLLKVRTSSMGRVLLLLGGNTQEIRTKRTALIQTLFSPEMLNASGIRTLSNKEKRFRSGSYHNGSVWPWDTFEIAVALEELGYYGLAWELHRRNLRTFQDAGVFPEFVRGDEAAMPQFNKRNIDVYSHIYQRQHRVEQVPQLIQGWSVGAAFQIEKRISKSMLKQTIPLQAKSSQKLALESQILSQIASIS